MINITCSSRTQCPSMTASSKLSLSHSPKTRSNSFRQSHHSMHQYRILLQIQHFKTRRTSRRLRRCTWISYCKPTKAFIKRISLTGTRRSNEIICRFRQLYNRCQWATRLIINHRRISQSPDKMIIWAQILELERRTRCSKRRRAQWMWGNPRRKKRYRIWIFQI